MQDVITSFQRSILQPVAELLFPIQSEGGFDMHHSFMVQYRANEGVNALSATFLAPVFINACLPMRLSCRWLATFIAMAVCHVHTPKQF